MGVVLRASRRVFGSVGDRRRGLTGLTGRRVERVIWSSEECSGRWWEWGRGCG